MPTEAAEQKPDLLGDARKSLTLFLMGDYDAPKIIAGVNSLNSALLASNLTPQNIYHELGLAAGQAKEKAQIAGDEQFAGVFGEMQTTFARTLERFAGGSEAVSAAQVSPTSTRDKAPMTSAKGGSARMSEPGVAATTAIAEVSRKLTAKEQEIVDLLRGSEVALSAAEIAKKVGLAETTVTQYVPKIRSKGININLARDESGNKAIGYKIEPESAPAE